MDKKVVLSLVNCLLDVLVMHNVLDQYIIPGYHDQIILATLLGTLVGSILFIRHPIKKAFLWILVAVALISIEELYRYLVIISLPMFIPPFEAWGLLVLVLMFFLGFAYLLMAFEIWVIEQIQKPKQHA